MKRDALEIAISEVVLRLGQALFSGFMVPYHRIGIALGNALAVVMAIPQRVLCHGIPVLRSGLKLLDSSKRGFANQP